MVCHNCGRELQDGDLFCQICGTRVEEPVQAESVQEEPQEYVQQEYQQPEAAEPVDYFHTQPPEMPKKKHGKKFWIPVVAVLLLVVFSVTVLASSGLRNIFMELVLSPGKYMAYVYEQELEDGAEIVAKTMIRNIGKQSDNRELVLDVSANEEMQGILYGMADAEVKPFIDWIDSAKLTVQTAAEKKLTGANGILTINGADITPVSVVNDAESGKMYITLSALNGRSLFVPGAVETDERAIFSAEIQSVPNEDVLERMLFTYSYTFIKEIASVAKSKETVTVADITQKLTVLTATMDNQTFSRAQIAVLEKMKQDKDLKKIVEDMQANADAGLSENTYNNMLESIDKAIGEAQRNAEITGEPVKIITYVDRGEIVGVSLEGNGTKMENITLEKGNRFSTRISIKSDTDIVIEGGGKKSGDRKNGSFAVKFSGAHMLDLNVSDLDMDKLEDGAFEGTLELKPADAMVSLLTFSGTEDAFAQLLPKARLVISGEASAKSDSLKLQIYKGEELYGTVSLDNSRGKGFALSVPADAVDANNTESMNAWMQGIDLDTLISNLKNAGANQELTGILELAKFGLMP